MSDIQHKEKKLKAEPKVFDVLSSVDWKKLQPPQFKRSFIDSNTLSTIIDDQKKNADDNHLWLKKLPSDAQAFLESNSGSTFAKPTSVQQEAWPQLLHGSNVICVAPTGSGKTLAFLIPALIVCEEAASRWKKGYKHRLEIEEKKKGSSMLSRSDLRFLGYSKDPLSPVRPAVLVLVPTRELGMQVSKQASLVLRTKGLRCCLIMGGIEPKKEKKSLEAPTPTHMMVATPGRLIDLIKERKIDLFSVCFVIIDEADRMLSMGLAEQVSMISNQIRPDVQLAVLSATLPDVVMEVASGWASTPLKLIRIGATDVIQTETNSRRTNRITSSLFDHVHADNNQGCNQDGNQKDNVQELDDDSEKEEDDDDDDDDGKNDIKDNEVSKRVSSSLAVSMKIEQQVHVCAPHKKPRKMIKWLLKMKSINHNKMRIIIFCNKISNVGTIVKLLQKNNGTTLGTDCKVAALHGRMPQCDRTSALKSFTKGDVRILICTDIAARGLHMPNLTHVLNYDFPSTLELYVHRIGRVGRLGQVSNNQDLNENNDQDNDDIDTTTNSTFGIAYSFFTRSLQPLAPELVKLLKECHQKVDPILLELAEAEDKAEEEGNDNENSDEDDNDEKGNETKFSSGSISNMVNALLQGDDDNDNDEENDDSDDENSTPFVGYALPSWLQKPTSKSIKKDKKKKKEKKKETSKKRVMEEDDSTKKTVKKMKNDDEKTDGVKQEEEKGNKGTKKEKVDKGSLPDDKSNIPTSTSSSTSSRDAIILPTTKNNNIGSIIKEKKTSFNQPFHNMPLHARLKIAHELKKDISELDHGIKPNVKANADSLSSSVIKTGKRPRGKRGGAKSKKKV